MFKLRPYQEPVADKVFDYLRKNPGKHPLVAMPTGSGKTVVLADIINTALRRWPQTKIVVLSHVKEILEQDYNALKFHLPHLEVGLHSAGLGRRERKQVTVAGIQSVYRKGDLFSDTQLIIVDECHLIPPGSDSMYRTFFSAMDKPRYLGLTATPFRLGAGYIYGNEEDHIFSDLIYDLTSMHKFNRLIKDGYLCNLKTQCTQAELDTTGIHTIGGDFDNKEMSLAFDKEQITKVAVGEIIKHGADYKKWLIFAIDIKHAESIADELSNQGIPTCYVHSKMDLDRDSVIQAYKQGFFRAMVNVNVLTTGFDDPEIDLIALLRPTKSPVIHVQTIGRGLRISENKNYCLVLDFAGNTERLGPINDIKVYKKQQKGEGGEPITKKCPKCDTLHHPTVKVCPFCGHKFLFQTALQTSAGGRDVIRTAKIKWYDVKQVEYKRHSKRNSPDSMRVMYHCGLQYFNEFVCIDHQGYAGHKGRHWARFRGNPCDSIEACLASPHEFNTPKRILVDKSGKYPIVIDFEF